MQNKRALIIFIEKQFFKFVLLNIYPDKAEIIASLMSRISNIENISLNILEILKEWGKEIGINFVRKDLIIRKETSKSGVSEIFIVTCEELVAELNPITNDIFINDRKIKNSGALNLAKKLDFSNIFIANFDYDKIFIRRIFKGDVNSNKLKVLSDTVKLNDFFNIDMNSKDLFSTITLEHSLNTLASGQIDNFISSYKKEDVYPYLISSLHALTQFNSEKLNLEDFGKGELNTSKLIISGELLRIWGNWQALLIAITTNFNILGNFEVFIDNHNLVDFLLNNEKQIFSENVYNELLLQKVCDFISFNQTNKLDFDEVIGEISISELEQDKQIIPLAGRIIKFKNNKTKNIIKISSFGKATINGNETIELSNIYKEVVLDSRCIFKNILDNKINPTKLDGLLLSWLRGVDAII